MFNVDSKCTIQTCKLLLVLKHSETLHTVTNMPLWFVHSSQFCTVWYELNLFMYYSLNIFQVVCMMIEKLWTLFILSMKLRIYYTVLLDKTWEIFCWCAISHHMSIPCAIPGIQIIIYNSINYHLFQYVGSGGLFHFTIFSMVRDATLYFKGGGMKGVLKTKLTHLQEVKQTCPDPNFLLPSLWRLMVHP